MSAADEVVLASLKRAAGAPVLVVDDDPQALTMKESMLTRLGYHAVCRSNRADAFAAIEAAPPAAIIINLMMPAMRGFELLDELRRMPATRAVPVIAWISREVPEDERRQLRIAVQTTWLRRSSTTEAMLEELRPHIAHWGRAPDPRSHAA